MPQYSTVMPTGAAPATLAREGSMLASYTRCGDKKLLDFAVILSATEVAVLLSTILLGLVLGRRFDPLNTRINLVSWLVCGAGSIALSIAGLIKASKRSAAVSVVAFCVVIFILRFSFHVRVRFSRRHARYLLLGSRMPPTRV
jgi:hypothetical protein